MNTQCDRLIVRNITVGFFLLDIVYNLRTVKPLDSQKAGNNTFFTQVLERLSETKLKPKHVSCIGRIGQSKKKERFKLQCHPTPRLLFFRTMN